jgi:hypothetical protein
LTVATAVSLEDALSDPPELCSAVKVWLRDEPVPLNCSCAGVTDSVCEAALRVFETGMTDEPPEPDPAPPHADSTIAIAENAAILGRACIARPPRNDARVAAALGFMEGMPPSE